jgi:4a-hydroxytetrahydrobiopterin dehydratase
MLKDETCAVPRNGEPQLSKAAVTQLLEQVPGWGIIVEDNIKRLRRIYRFKDFLQALAFTNRIADIAEAQDHHPALLTEWGRVTITWWTHTVNGLHRNDFIMAAKTDAVYAVN